MVNLITGPKGTGKTQQMIELANEKVKTSNGNVVFIKKSHRNTTTLDFGVRAICMEDYPDILTMDEFIGFLYGMVAGNHDIDTIFIDSVLKQADISLNNISAFMTSPVSYTHLDVYKRQPISPLQNEVQMEKAGLRSSPAFLYRFRLLSLRSR